MGTDRYSFTPTRKTTEGKRYYRDWIPPTIPQLDSDVYIISKDGDRLDLLAYRFYKDSTLWWIIAEANGLVGSFYIQPGTRLRIPQNVQDVTTLSELTNSTR